jgi:hypothetical protein
MAKIKHKRNQKMDKMIKLGLFLVELVKVTNDGELPINQTELRKRLKVNHRISIPPATSTEYVKILENDLARVWIKTDGHNVSLFSEEETLSNSIAIEALFIANALVDSEDCINIEEWISKCEANLQCPPETCRGFIEDFFSCKYAISRFTKKAEMIHLDVRAFNEDNFYLKQARNANIKRRLSRRKSQS